MRRTPRLILFTLAAACWLAAGPGGTTLQAVLACRHHALHQSHPGHGAPTGPCFCGRMTGSADLALSVAVPAPLPASPAIAMPQQIPVYPSLSPLPPSPSFSPTPPPPNGLG